MMGDAQGCGLSPLPPPTARPRPLPFHHSYVLTQLWERYYSYRPPRQPLPPYYPRQVFKDASPFYAGFGNRGTDVMSYREVSIPDHKIFTIDTSGKLTINNCKYENYCSVRELVDQVPPSHPTLASCTDQTGPGSTFVFLAGRLLPVWVMALHMIGIR